MKKILTFLSLMLCFFATAQEVTDTMYIYRNDNTIERIPVSKIDSVVFVAPKAPQVPETPTVAYEAIDLGLPSGVKWATCNVGASSPEEYGGYYAWGEIEEKDSYTEDNSVTYGKSMGDISGNPEYDVACAKWGGAWRMPTLDEMYELRNNCTLIWTTLNGVNGYEVTGPNGNSIFLPAAGFRIGTEFSGRGSGGYYWSSSVYDDYSTYCLYFISYIHEVSYRHCYFGQSVRPVCDSTINPVESYTVSVSSNGNGVVSIEGTQESSVTVSAGASVTIVATPADGYKFIGWYIGESETPVSTDATYTFTVSANVALVAKFEAEESADSGNLNGHDYVDLGLPSGLKWATCNVGASSPEEYGGYYAWGETDEKDDCSWSTYRWCNGTYNSMTKYCTSASNGTVDNKTVLEPEDDVAHVKWGGNWRMPTKAEQDELCNNCTWTWTTLNGVNGYEVTGPNGNSIFLPAAGYRYGTEVDGRGDYGYYWSSSLYGNGSDFAYYLGFYDSSYYWGNGSRYCGLSVRPVCDSTINPVESYTVSVSSNGNGVVSIEGTQESTVTVSAGARVTVVATPADGYKFIGWYIGESETPVSTDATYTFTVSANVALVAKFEAEESADSGNLNGHDYVDLGLSVKWATCNVGASSPEEYGGYYAWGEINEKDDYGWDTYRWCNGTYDSMTKYCTNDSYGTVDNKSLLDPEDDVAHVKWGGSWRMPTRAEQDELRNNCTWTWTTLNGVNGYQVTGPNGNSIFLPAAGYRNGTGVYSRGGLGYYWSSSLSSNYSNYAYRLDFNDSSYDWYSYYRYYGLSVRPVSQ